MAGRKSFLDPFTQIGGSTVFDDQLADAQLALAESFGKKRIGYADGSTVSGTPTKFTDSTNDPFTAGDVGNYLYIPAGDPGAGTYLILTYVDAENITVSGAAFGDASGINYEVHYPPNMEDELNALRTIARSVKDPASDWMDSMPTYTNPKATGTPKLANLVNLAGKTLDAYTVITALAANGRSVVATNTEITIPDITKYATSTDRTGLPMADVGEYDQTNYYATFVELIDPETGGPVVDPVDDKVVWGRMFKGVELTNFKCKFYKGTNDASGTTFTWTAALPTTINVIYGQRQTHDDVSEDFLRRRFLVGVDAPGEIVEDIRNLQKFTGGGHGEYAPTWTQTGQYYCLYNGGTAPTTLEGGINAINEAIGNRTYTTETYLTNGQTITASLDALQSALSGVAPVKQVYRVPADIPTNTNISVPSGTYTLDTVTWVGQWMDVYYNGMLLTHDSSAVLDDADYEEVSTTQIKIHSRVKAGANITFVVRK